MQFRMVLGIDPGKYFFSAILRDAQGELVWKESGLEMNRAGFTALLQRLPQTGVIIGVEASGRIGYNLMAELGRWVAKDRAGRRLIRINPGQTARFSGPRLRRDQTDQSDADRVCEYTRVYGQRLVDFEQDESAQAMARCAVERQRLSEELTAVKNRIHDQLMIVFPEFTQLFPDPFGAIARAVLRQVPTAAHARKRQALSLARVKAGRRSPSLGVERARCLIEFARHSVACATSQLDAGTLLHLLDQLELIQSRIQQIDQSLKDFVQTPSGPLSDPSHSLAQQIALADTLPGIALVSASTLVLRAGGIDRYSAGKALAAQWAACPERVQTGVSLNQTRLTHRGDHKARAMLYLCAQAATTCDAAFAFHKWRAVQAGQRPQQAVCCCMNRLARVLHSVITHHQPYDVNHMIAQIQIHHADLWKTFVSLHRQHSRIWKKVDSKWLKTA